MTKKTFKNIMAEVTKEEQEVQHLLWDSIKNKRVLEAMNNDIIEVYTIDKVWYYRRVTSHVAIPGYVIKYFNNLFSRNGYTYLYNL